MRKRIKGLKVLLASGDAVSKRDDIIEAIDALKKACKTLNRSVRRSAICKYERISKAERQEWIPSANEYSFLCEQGWFGTRSESMHNSMVSDLYVAMIRGEICFNERFPDSLKVISRGMKTRKMQMV